MSQDLAPSLARLQAASGVQFQKHLSRFSFYKLFCKSGFQFCRAFDGKGYSSARGNREFESHVGYDDSRTQNFLTFVQIKTSQQPFSVTRLGDFLKLLGTNCI